MFGKENVPYCGNCKFKLDCIYSQLSQEAQKKWNEIRIASKFSDKEPIYTEGDRPEGIYVVCMGRVKISSTDFQGQQMITWIRHPAEIFGHIALFSEKEFHCNTESMRNSIISFIDRKKFQDLMDNHPGLALLMMKKMAIENRTMQLKLKDTAYKPAKSKIAHTLIKHISFKSRNTPNPTIYGLKRTEIAELTGLALETVVRTLSELEKKKIIKRSPSYIKILDYDSLCKISGQQR
ncbi:MAG: hypothetical protein Fur0012_07730 [Elusimicrobiota bacterium]